MKMGNMIFIASDRDAMAFNRWILEMLWASEWRERDTIKSNQW